MDKYPSWKGGNGRLPDFLRAVCYWQDKLGNRWDRIERRLVNLFQGLFILTPIILSIWK